MDGWWSNLLVLYLKQVAAASPESPAADYFRTQLCGRAQLTAACHRCRLQSWLVRPLQDCEPPHSRFLSCLSCGPDRIAEEL